MRILQRQRDGAWKMHRTMLTTARLTPTITRTSARITTREGVTANATLSTRRARVRPRPETRTGQRTGALSPDCVQAEYSQGPADIRTYQLHWIDDKQLAPTSVVSARLKPRNMTNWS